MALWTAFPGCAGRAALQQVANVDGNNVATLVEVLPLWSVTSRTSEQTHDHRQEVSRMIKFFQELMNHYLDEELPDTEGRLWYY